MLPKPWPERLTVGTPLTGLVRSVWLLAVLAAVVVLSGCTAAARDGSTPTPTSTPPSSEVTPTATSTTSDSTPSLTTLPSIADLVDQVEPAVVSIVTETTIRTVFGLRPRVGSGSGVIFREDGYILTNNHVVEDADLVLVTLSDGRDLEADIVGTDPLTDLAVVRVDSNGLPTVPLGDASTLRVGDWVVAIGSAAGLPGGPSITLGIVSALDRSRSILTGDVRLADLIQTDAIINPGNSGGPLLNLQGEVVGINTFVLRDDEIEGIGFAVSTDTVIPVADQLVRDGRVVWTWLGVTVSDNDRLKAAEMDLTVNDGVVIMGVEPSGPAERAGIRPEDVIVALDGEATPNFKILQRLLRTRFKVGQRITVTVVRGDDRKELTLTLGEYPR